MAGADGNWNVTLNTPMGAQQATLTLATDGDTLTGQFASPQGAIDLENGKVNGDELSWSVTMTQPMPMTITATAKVDGDNISGDMALGAFGNASFSGTRA